MDKWKIEEIEKILGYHFFEPQHLIRALTHPAYANELLQQNKRCMDQEAYRTLGDAVLKTSLILFLMEKGIQTKGGITMGKEDLESNAALARIAARMQIKDYIMLGKGEEGLWSSGEAKILADTLEALIGAIFLDSDAGFGVIKQCIGTWFEPELEIAGIAKQRGKDVYKETGRKKQALMKTRVTERLVPRQITPHALSARRGVSRRTKRGS
jgi:ribonuclease-3